MSAAEIKRRLSQARFRIATKPSFRGPPGGVGKVYAAVQPAPIVVQRRRDRLVDESARALRGERSVEPVPAGVGEDEG